jgi:hypothetical protein
VSDPGIDMQIGKGGKRFSKINRKIEMYIIDCGEGA